MGRILSIDYGLKRTGLAVTDPMQIIVQGLETVETKDLMTFMEAYVKKEVIDEMVVGYPFTDENFGDSAFRKSLEAFIQKLKKSYPDILITLHDERFTSVQAKEIIRQSGKKKSQRQDKRLLDQTSAVLILQEYLGHI